MDFPLKAYDPFQRAAAGACVGMVVVLALFQFVLTPDRQAPPGLFMIFSFIWVFGAFMLFLIPRFGAVGTAVWGFISAAGALQTHADNLGPENVVLVGGSLATSGLAIAFIVREWRKRGRPAARKRSR